MWKTQRLPLRYFTVICLDMLKETNEHLGQNSGYRGWVAQLWPAEFQNKSVRTQPQCCASDLSDASVFEGALYSCVCLHVRSRARFVYRRCQKLRLYSVSDIMELWWDASNRVRANHSGQMCPSAILSITSKFFMYQLMHNRVALKEY